LQARQNEVQKAKRVEEQFALNGRRKHFAKIVAGVDYVMKTEEIQCKEVAGVGSVIMVGISEYAKRWWECSLSSKQ
jgi:hypothetical protein